MHRFQFSEAWGARLSSEAPTLMRARGTFVKENLELMKGGGFNLDDGTWVIVPQAPATERICPPSAPQPSATSMDPCREDLESASSLSTALVQFSQTNITVALMDTLSAALALGEHGAALNFANATSHGGGYKHGARAQEEDLCRLLPQLIHSLEYVEYPIKEWGGECLVTRNLVAVRRVGTYDLCVSQGLVNMLTSAMPCGDAGEHGGKSWNDTVSLRIRGVLHAAKVSGFTKLALGAWGCGAFGNPPHLVAKLFRAQLGSSEFRGAFSDVVFAIIDPIGDGNLQPFYDEISKMHET